MEWFEPKDKFPDLSYDGKTQRCLAFCHAKGNFGRWEGFIEVYFNPSIGWRRCETNKTVEVIKWTYLENITHVHRS